MVNNDDPLRVLALGILAERMRRNMPSVKLARQLKASQRESMRAMVRARRSLSASQASSKRKLDLRLSDLERESRDRQLAQDAESDRRCWNLLLGHGRPGV